MILQNVIFINILTFMKRMVAHMKSSVTRATLARKVGKKAGIPESEAGIIINTLVNSLCKSITTGEKVNIMHFGSFQQKSKKPRIGRNPKTLKNYEISARTVIKYVVSKDLKQKINGESAKNDKNESN